MNNFIISFYLFQFLFVFLFDLYNFLILIKKEIKEYFDR